MSAEEPDYYPYNLLGFARQVSDRLPVLKAVYDQHFGYWGEIFPTMYLSDVVRAFVPLYLDPRTRRDAVAILEVMEEGMAHDDPAVVNEVAVGFVEMLPYGDDVGATDIQAALPPRLRAAWEQTYGQVEAQ